MSSSFLAIFCVFLAVCYADAPYGVAAELPQNLKLDVSDPSFGLIEFSVSGKKFAFNAQGTLQILSNNNILYQSNGGIYYDPGSGYVAPPVQNTVTLPDLDTQLPAGQVKVAGTEWVLSSGVWAFAKNGLLDVTITPADVPATLPLKLNTDSPFWLQIVPGFSAYPNANLTLSITPNSAWPAVTLGTNNTVTFSSFSFAVTIDIVKGNTVVLPAAVVLQVELTVSAYFAFSLVPGGASVSAFLSLVSFSDNETVTSTKVGAVNVVVLKELIELASKFAKFPPVDVALPDGITLTALQVKTNPGYVYALATLKTSVLA